MREFFRNKYIIFAEALVPDVSGIFLALAPDIRLRIVGAILIANGIMSLISALCADRGGASEGVA